MRMLVNLFLAISVSFLVNCANGPKVTAWISDPANSYAFVTSKNGKTQTLAYSASQGYAVYPPQSAQAVLDYCAARNASGTAAPEFTQCTSDPSVLGFLCHSVACQINGEMNGAICTISSPDFLVTYPESDQYVAFSPADETTLFAYCNISL